jgi:hypothetical protein
MTGTLFSRKSLTLQDSTEEHLQQQLAAIATHYGNVGAFIHIHPVFQANHNSSVAYFPEEKAIIKYSDTINYTDFLLFPVPSLPIRFG